jgi:(2Fe-2S) ferredoxin
MSGDSPSRARFTVMVCRGPTCGDARNSGALTAQLRETVAARGLEEEITIAEETCFGHCLRGPNILVYSTDDMKGTRVYGPGADAPSAVLYNRMTPADLARIIDRHLVGGMVVRPLLNRFPIKDS